MKTELFRPFFAARHGDFLGARQIIPDIKFLNRIQKAQLCPWQICFTR
jgi:hypothetical protein